MRHVTILSHWKIFRDFRMDRFKIPIANLNHAAITVLLSSLSLSVVHFQLDEMKMRLLQKAGNPVYTVFLRGYEFKPIERMLLGFT